MQRVFVQFSGSRVAPELCSIHWALVPEGRGDQGGLLIGRGPQLAPGQPIVTLPDLYVARQQAELWSEEDRLHFTNLSTRQQVRLSDKTTIMIRDTRSLEVGIRFMIGETLGRTCFKDLRWLVNAAKARKVAESIASSERFDEMPILADALEEAGCADEDVLIHCRDATSHEPGCWVLQLLTNSSDP